MTLLLIHRKRTRQLLSRASHWMKYSQIPSVMRLTCDVIKMLNCNSYGKISAPIALHWDSAKETTLVEQLMREVASQREKNQELSLEIMAQRKRSVHLESCLNQFLSHVPRIPSWGSIEEPISKVNSTNSMKELVTSACFIPKSASLSSIATSADSQWASVPKVDSWSSIASACLETNDVPVCPASTTVGAYPSHIRQQKIRTYKEKQRKYREKFNISRVFNGRSQAAKKKLRVNGKFVKAECV
mmetsp:Transcript_31902/g.54952  ORF Transcript_31902/g.54952 Transcript_31902/m.54952 type:complete len:244 (-) Transcript_31902:1317-2048(-)